jgi:two-component system chemotaxis response regulator CheB
VFSCPECHGTLWESDHAGILRFRCRVGHVYSPESMLAVQTDSVDRALWAALRSLEERAALIRRLAERARARNHAWVARTFEERAQAAEEHAAVVRRVVTTRQTSPIAPDHAVQSEEPVLVAEAHMPDRSAD